MFIPIYGAFAPDCGSLLEELADEGRVAAELRAAARLGRVLDEAAVEADGALLERADEMLEAEGSAEGEALVDTGRALDRHAEAVDVPLAVDALAHHAGVPGRDRDVALLEDVGHAVSRERAAVLVVRVHDVEVVGYRAHGERLAAAVPRVVGRRGAARPREALAFGRVRHAERPYEVVLVDVEVPGSVDLGERGRAVLAKQVLVGDLVEDARLRRDDLDLESLVVGGHARVGLHAERVLDEVALFAIVALEYGRTYVLVADAAQARVKHDLELAAHDISRRVSGRAPPYLVSCAEARASGTTGRALRRAHPLNNTLWARSFFRILKVVL